MKLFKELMGRSHNPVCGYSEEEDHVLVLVTEKKPLDDIVSEVLDVDSPWTHSDVVPDDINGKECKVLAIGEVQSQANSVRYRPLVGGCQMQPRGARYVGTLGIVARAAKFGGRFLVGKLASFRRILDIIGLNYSLEPVILTNTHVVQDDVSRVVTGRGVAQPSGRSLVGNVLWSNPIIEGKNNFVDAAICSLNNPSSVYEVIDLPLISGYRNPVYGESVSKTGRTTGTTHGKCIGTNASMSVNYAGRSMTFVGCKLFSRMSAAGDSGSVIVSDSDSKVVSLLFAGSDKVTIGCDITRVVDASGVVF